MSARQRPPSGHLRAGLVAIAVAAIVNGSVAVVAERLGASLVVPGDDGAIPALAFPQLTVLAGLIGLGIASAMYRASRRPAAWFVAVTGGLTVASLVPPATVGADAPTTAILLATHLIAAAIIVPTIAARLPRDRPALTGGPAPRPEPGGRDRPHTLADGGQHAARGVESGRSSSRRRRRP